MNKEQAVKYLSFSGFSDEQIKAIEGAFTCDKCVYSTSEGCQYDDITETIPPFETSDDAISRQAVLDVTWEEPSYTDALNVLTEVRDKVKALPPVNPQKPCEDAISRKEAISIAGIATLSVNQVVAALKKLPSVSSSEKPNKSEWQHDHEILKAYSDGASAVLNKVRAEIADARFIDKDTKHCKNANASGLEVAMDIIDKYIEEGKE